jgi:hypothetical protein
MMSLTVKSAAVAVVQTEIIHVVKRPIHQASDFKLTQQYQAKQSYFC